jgi:hypothetical protein
VVVRIQCFSFDSGRGGDEALPKDEAEVANSSWLYRKEA